MVIRFVLLFLIGIGCWLLTCWCLSKKIAFVRIEDDHSSSPVQQWERTESSYTLPRWNEIDPEIYTYDQYLYDIPWKMIKSENEYQVRQNIFDTNLKAIHTFNQQQQKELQKGGHRLGLNHFMDLLPHELPQPGYDKSQHAGWSISAIDPSISSLSDLKPLKEHQLDYWTMIDELTMDQNIELPKQVDWRMDTKTGKPLITPIKNQGPCGSCWSFATTACLESYAALSSPNRTLMSLSMQELVSCVPNPNHCGGTGGCGGSTAELALEFIHEHGLVDEWHFGYQSFSGTHKVPCSLHHHQEPEEEEASSSKYYDNAAVTVTGYVKLPTNNYTALMHAVAKHGPVIVNVASNPWRFYEGGVFSARGHGVDQTDINHVVVLYGYGTDKETGEDYWLVRNSYGPKWGEEGFIRLKRIDPTTLPQPDADCGMDVRPADGIACTEQNHHHHVKPPAVKVCGTSGILFDPVLPIGVKMLP